MLLSIRRPRLEGPKSWRARALLRVAFVLRALRRALSFSGKLMFSLPPP